MASFDRLLVLLGFYIYIYQYLREYRYPLQSNYIQCNVCLHKPILSALLHNIVWLSLHHVLVNKKVVNQSCCGVSRCSVKDFTSIYQCNFNTLFPVIPPKDWLTPIEEALAQRLGIGQSTVANKLRLLKLPQEVQDALIQKQITERDTRSKTSVVISVFRKWRGI